MLSTQLLKFCIIPQVNDFKQQLMNLSKDYPRLSYFKFQLIYYQIIHETIFYNMFSQIVIYFNYHQYIKYLNIMNIFICIIVLTFQSLQTLSLGFIVEKTLKCKSFDGNRCLNWITNGSLTMISPSCFPAHTLVLTSNGPKSLKQLRINDQILAYNKQKKINQFTPILAWLHRYQNKKFEYFKIQTRDFYFYSSARHNIGIGKKQRIKFQFAKDIKGQNLILQDQKTESTVLKLTREIGRGVYAPYTQLSNFYIIGENKNIFNKYQNKNNLILVHTFAQIKKPQSYENIFRYSIKIANLFGLNRNPSSNEQYIHPLASIYSKLFPEMIDYYNPVYGHYSSYIFDIDDVTSMGSSSNQRKHLRRVLKIYSILSTMVQTILISG